MDYFAFRFRSRMYMYCIDKAPLLINHADWLSDCARFYKGDDNKNHRTTYNLLEQFNILSLVFFYFD